ncbi:hypothetical protein RDI58_005855 [Solanum bulbocastanum]|uniref:peroxidase n=1 Tax=Solanum bulbocastanum TaxID=147425 RepID=A0AAN8TZV6_SOLBU
MFSKNWALMAVFSFLVICLVTTMAAQAEVDPGSASGFPFLLRYNYYDEKCEDLEGIVWSKMKTIVQLQHNAPAQLLRLMFHDCFIGAGGPYFPVLTGRRDSNESFLDNHYYKTLMRGRGLLFAAQQLMVNEKTAAAVTDYAIDVGIILRTKFAHSMAKLFKFGVLYWIRRRR